LKPISKISAARWVYVVTATAVTVVTAKGLIRRLDDQQEHEILSPFIIDSFAFHHHGGAGMYVPVPSIVLL
jgi:hypothetical protein